MTLLSLDMGVGRTVPFVAFVRVTPLGPGFTPVVRNLEVFVDFAGGSLEGAGACSFALLFPFLSTSVVSVAGGGAGVGVVTSEPEDPVKEGNSDES